MTEALQRTQQKRKITEAGTSRGKGAKKITEAGVKRAKVTVKRAPPTNNDKGKAVIEVESYEENSEEE